MTGTVDTAAEPKGKLQFQWIGQYHGLNPWAPAPVLVGEIMGDLFVHARTVEVACRDLWAQVDLQDRWEMAPPAHADMDGWLTTVQCAVRWSQCILNEHRGWIRHAGAERVAGGVRLWLGFHHPEVSKSALQLAMGFLLKRLKGEPNLSSLQPDVERIWQNCKVHHPDYQARILMVGAHELNVPFFRHMPGQPYWQFGWGKHSRVFMESASNQDGLLGAKWQQNKTMAKSLMHALGLPTPKHVLVRREEALAEAVAAVGCPCVVKPMDTGGGRGVTANIGSVQDAVVAYQRAFQQRNGDVLVEQHVLGEDHRLMVIEGKLVAAIRREAAWVVGDGHRTVAELLAELNAPRSKNMVRSRYLRPIPMDEVLAQHLRTQSIALDDVPAPHRRVTLRSNANLSTGGICTDVTDRCHDQVRAMAELLAKASGLMTVGIDYLTTDITKTPAETQGGFIEMNTTPGMDACVAAGWSEGKIARMVLGERLSRIAVDLTLLRPSGLQRMAQGIEKIQVSDEQAWVVGQTLRLEKLTLALDGDTPWAAVQAALRNPSISHLHVLCTAQDIERLGSPVDVLAQVVVAADEKEESVVSPLWFDTLKKCCDRITTRPEKDILQSLLGPAQPPFILPLDASP